MFTISVGAVGAMCVCRQRISGENTKAELANAADTALRYVHRAPKGILGSFLCTRISLDLVGVRPGQFRTKGTEDSGQQVYTLDAKEPVPGVHGGCGCRQDPAEPQAGRPHNPRGMGSSEFSFCALPGGAPGQSRDVLIPAFCSGRGSLVTLNFSDQVFRLCLSGISF